MTDNDISKIESTLDYSFENKDLLQQAFVRRSYSEENGGQNNEFLEFIGDKALDLAVIRLMTERFGEVTENKEFQELKLHNPKYFKTKSEEGAFTDIKKELVQKKALAKIIDSLGFHKLLIMGKGDIKNNVQEQDSVKEDLFEAIIGAVAYDSDFNMDAITYVVNNLLDLDSYFEESSVKDKDTNYVGLLQEWAQENGCGLPKYEYYLDDDNLYECTVTLEDPDDDFFLQETGSEASMSEARKNAAYNAYRRLVDQGLLENEFEEAVGEPNEEEAIRQVNELFQKGMISEPLVIMDDRYDNNGNPYWWCSITISPYELDHACVGRGPTKKEAKREACYKLLCDLMGYEHE